jgi:hypothetical protein
MIFKIQRPITDTAPDEDPFALIYNQSREIEFTIPMAAMDRFWKDVGGGLAKVYVEASLNEDEGFVIEDLLEDQSW